MNKHGIRLITAVVTSSMIVTPVLAAPSVDDLKKGKSCKAERSKFLAVAADNINGKSQYTGK